MTQASDCIDCVAGQYLDSTGNDRSIGLHRRACGWQVRSVSRSASGWRLCRLCRWDVRVGDGERRVVRLRRVHCRDVCGCDAGSDEAGDCIGCAPGKFTSVTGSDQASDCIECVAGKYIDVSGSDQASDCIECAAGMFVEAEGSVQASDCIGCIAGTYLESTGSDEAARLHRVCRREVQHAGSPGGGQCMS